MAGELLPGHLDHVADYRGTLFFAFHFSILNSSFGIAASGGQNAIGAPPGLAPGPACSRQRKRAMSYFPGMYFAPNTGSLCGIGGNTQAPVPGGRVLGSTCTSMRHGFPSAMACARAPLKSSDFMTVNPSTPAGPAPTERNWWAD